MAEHEQAEQRGMLEDVLAIGKHMSRGNSGILRLEVLPGDFYTVAGHKALDEAIAALQGSRAEGCIAHKGTIVYMQRSGNDV